MGRFKIDENLSPESAALLRAHGHDAHSVLDEGLAGAKDARIQEACLAERRTLITQDVRLVDARVLPPAPYAGVILLRLSHTGLTAQLRTIERLIPVLSAESFAGRICVVSEDGIRFRPRDAAP